MFKRKRKMIEFPRVDPTLLKDTAGIDSLKRLPDGELLDALAAAGHVEGWALTMVKGLEKTEPDSPLIEPFVGAAMHSRIAREVMAIELTLRDEGKGHEDGRGGQSGPNGQGPKKGLGYL